MSLLLDALKKAAQEKLDRQQGEPPAAPGRAESNRPTRTELPAESERTDYADESSDADGAAATEYGDQTTSAAGRASTLSDTHRFQAHEGATELELAPSDKTAGPDRRPDTTGYEAPVGHTETPELELSDDELDAYLSDDARTTRPAPDRGEPDGAAAEDHTDPTYRHSLTENLRMEQAGYGGYQATGTPDQAAQIFTSKAASSGNRTRLFVLIGLAAVAALALAGLFGYEFIARMDQSDMVYTGSRTRLSDRPPVRDDPAPQAAAREPAEDVDPALLIEQEDYSGLFKETAAEYEAESQAESGARETADRSAETAGPTEPAPSAAPAPRPAERRTVAGRAGEFSIQRGRPAGGEPLRAVLMRGWRAYNQGELETAEVAYQQALQRSPRNRDALLGLAAIDQVRGETAKARQRYRRLLELNPRDELALAGLTGLAGGRPGTNAAAGDISRIKTLLSERPEAPHLHFTLGNLYAGQKRWSDAQQAYFNAYRFGEGNPDYAFNLAVSLEHLGQDEPALRFYREALRASNDRRAHFNPAALQNRIESLSNRHATSPATKP